MPDRPRRGAPACHGCALSSSTLSIIHDGALLDYFRRDYSAYTTLGRFCPPSPRDVSEEGHLDTLYYIRAYLPPKMLYSFCVKL